MAKRSRTKSACAKRAYKRTRAIAHPRRTIPDNLKVMMKYQHNIYLTSAIIPEAYTTFRALSIYDPDYTGGGGQPYGHDSFANLYLRYRVKRVKIDVWFQNISTTAPTAVAISAHESLASPPLSYQVAVENPTSTMTTMGTRTNGAPNQAKLSLGWFDPASFKGDKGAKYDQDYQAQFGSNPAKDFGLTVYVRNMTGGASVEARAIAVLTYEVELYDRVQQVAS